MSKKGTTVRYDDFDYDLVAAAAEAKNISVAEFLARAGRTAALREQLAADRGDGSLSAYYQVADAATAQLWQASP